MKPVRVVVDSRLRIRSPEVLPPPVEDELREEFTHANPAHERWASLSARTRKFAPEPPETIETWRREADGSLSLPRGGTDRLRRIFGDNGLRASFDDQRSSGTQAPWAYARSLRHDLKLFDFQEEMVEAAFERQNCILRAPCGAGKTSVGIAIAARVGVSTIVVVPSTRIFDEWVIRLQSELGLQPDEVGWFGRGKRRIRPITVATLKTLSLRVHEVADLFGCVIFDEVQKAPATTVYPAVDALPCKYRIGISADERRKDRKHGINYDLFGRVAVDVPQRALVEQGVVHAVDVRLVPTDFAAPWYVALPDREKRDPNAYRRLLDQVVADVDRNDVAGAVALDLIEKGPTLVFSHRVEHCMRLRADILDGGARRLEYRVGVVLGEETYRAESDATVAGLLTGTYQCGVGTYQSIGTGVNLPSVEFGVAVTPILANKQNFCQIRDRLCRVDRRPGATKRGATLYVLWDRKVFGDRPLRNALSWCGGRVEVLDGAEWVGGREYIDRSDDCGLLPRHGVDP